MLANHIRPAIGDLPLRRITREHVRDLLLETMPKSVGRAVTVSAQTLLNAVLAEAVRSERIRSNPAARIRLEAAQEAAEFGVPTRKQLDIMTAEMPDDWALSLWLMRGRGLRIGEALAVSENSVRSGVCGSASRCSTIRQGSARSSTASPVSTGTCRFRATWRRGSRITSRITGRPRGYFFQGRRLTLPSQNSYRYQFVKARTKAGLSDEFSPHDLRHVFASVALANWIPVTDVSRWLGHRSVDTTYKIYSHFVPDAFERARDVLEAEFEALD